MHRIFPWVLAAACAAGGAAGAGAAPRAVVQQAPAFAAPGVESYQATAQIQFQLGITKAQAVNLAGSLVFKRGAPGDANGNQKRDVRTEIVALDLRGNAPDVGAIQLVARPERASTGLIEARAARTDYPAAAFTDLFLMVRTRYGPIIADQPLRLAGAIAKPPAVNVSLAMAGKAPILLYYLTPGGPLPVGQITKMTAKTGAEIPNPPPLGGLDCLPTTATLDVDVPGDDGETVREPVRLTGTTAVKRGDPRDSDANGRWEIPTEIVAMELTGESARLGHIPLVVTIDPRADHASVGRIEPRAGGQNFPADSFFDLFVQIQSSSGVAAANEERVRLAAAGGIDNFPPGLRPFVLPLALDLQSPAGDVVGQTVALTLVFGDPTPCQPSLLTVGPGDDHLTALATVELELADFGPAAVQLSGPLTIRRGGGGDLDGPGPQLPRAGAEIVTLDLRGTVTDDRGQDLPVQLLIDRAAGTPSQTSRGLLIQTRADSALPLATFLDVSLEVRVGAGDTMKRYCTAAPVRLAGVFQSLPGHTPLCATSEEAPNGPVDVTLLDCADMSTEVGTLRWGCLLPQ
jgi:hypothetical protein